MPKSGGFFSHRLWLHCAALLLALFWAGCDIDSACREGPLLPATGSGTSVLRIIQWLLLGAIAIAFMGTLASLSHLRKMKNWDLSQSVLPPAMTKDIGFLVIGGVGAVIAIVVLIMLLGASNCPPGDRNGAVWAWFAGTAAAAVAVWLVYRGILGKRYQ